METAAPTSTTNITGFFTISRGSSLPIAAGSEVSSILGWNAPELRRAPGAAAGGFGRCCSETVMIRVLRRAVRA